MSEMIGLHMAQRKTRPQRPAKAPPDLGTPETRAKLKQPPWNGWDEPHRYASAAIEIDTAWRLLCAGLLAGAGAMLSAGGYSEDWTAAERIAVLRYRKWQARIGRALDTVLDAIVDCRTLDPVRLAVLKGSLDLYLEFFPTPIDKRTEIIDNLQ